MKLTFGITLRHADGPPLDAEAVANIVLDELAGLVLDQGESYYTVSDVDWKM